MSVVISLVEIHEDQKRHLRPFIHLHLITKSLLSRIQVVIYSEEDTFKLLVLSPELPHYLEELLVPLFIQLRVLPLKDQSRKLILKHLCFILITVIKGRRDNRGSDPELQVLVCQLLLKIDYLPFIVPSQHHLVPLSILFIGLAPFLNIHKVGVIISLS